MFRLNGLTPLFYFSTLFPTFTVTSGSTVGDAWVMASYMASSASARIIITADNPPVPIPSAVWLLGSGLVGLVGLRRKFKKA